jgi:hypothetical protein
MPAVLESLGALAPGAGFLLGGVVVTLLDPRTCLVALATAIAGVALIAPQPVARWRRSRRSGVRVRALRAAASE